MTSLKTYSPAPLMFMRWMDFSRFPRSVSLGQIFSLERFHLFYALSLCHTKLFSDLGQQRDRIRHIPTVMYGIIRQHFGDFDIARKNSKYDGEQPSISAGKKAKRR